jgi:hypothetical protein
MTAPGTHSRDLYEQTLPLHGPDPDGVAMDYVGALASQAEEIDVLVRDDEQGRPGWGVILDVDECPPKGLRWLSQVAGVTLRQPKLVPASVLANPNALDPEVNTSGWASSTTVAGGSTGLSASTDISSGRL